MNRAAAWVGVVRAIEISRATMRNGDRNLVGTFIDNVMGRWYLEPNVPGAKRALEAPQAG